MHFRAAFAEALSMFVKNLTEKKLQNFKTMSKLLTADKPENIFSLQRADDKFIRRSAREL
jgi:hypothetical protein